VQEIVLGEAVFSDTVCATDPCYAEGTWCGEFDLKVKPGIYTGKTITGESGSWGIRNWRLTTTKKDEEIVEWRFCIELGVDAGTMSIYDKPHYDELNTSGDWMQLTPRSGTPHGFVVSSGYGDGAYHLFTGLNADEEVVGLSILFLTPSGFNKRVFADTDSVKFSDPRFIPFAGCPVEDFIEEEE